RPGRRTQPTGTRPAVIKSELPDALLRPFLTFPQRPVNFYPFFFPFFFSLGVASALLSADADAVARKMRFLVTFGAVALALASVGQAGKFPPGAGCPLPLSRALQEKNDPRHEFVQTRQLDRRDDGGSLIEGPGHVVNPTKPLPGDDSAGGEGRLVRRVLEGRSGPLGRLGKRVLKARQLGGLVGGLLGSGSAVPPVVPAVPAASSAVGSLGLSDILNLPGLPPDAVALLLSNAVQTAIQATQAILNTADDNGDITAAGQNAQAALETASSSIASIQSDVSAGIEPDSADRAAADQGVRDAAAAIEQLSAAAGPNPDSEVLQAIDSAKDAIGEVVAGTQQALGLGGDAGVL
ncbi:MAG: hypothetical protein BJ554DRAFT_4173, partial [Olpidium bornovanus]